MYLLVRNVTISGSRVIHVEGNGEQKYRVLIMDGQVARASMENGLNLLLALMIQP
jgi:hypothetical protein